MIKHILTLMWNKRKANFLLYLEIFLAFTILFAVFTISIHYFRIYRTPLGFDTEHIWTVNLPLWEIREDSAKIVTIKKQLKPELLDISGVEQVAFSSNITPFSSSTWSTSNDDNGFELRTLILQADEQLQEVLGLQLIEGRWFTEDDQQQKYTPVVITQQLWEEVFYRQPVIDSVYVIIEGENKIIGIVDHYKYNGEFVEEEGASFEYHPLHSPETFALNLRIAPGASPLVEKQVNEAIAGVIKRNDFVIRSLEKQRQRLSREVWVPMTALLCICGFLILNVALGLFGVLWYNISKRKGEIGIRRSMGATRGSITWQFVGEVLTVTILALLTGSLFALQMPLLATFKLEAINYYYAIALTILLIVGIVIVCALYPSRQAAQIHPAVALHEE